MLVFVCRSHPEPTQTFHRRMAAAVAALGVPTTRVALRRARGGTFGPVRTTTPGSCADEGGSAVAAFLRRPWRAMTLLVGGVLRARSGDKEGGRLGAAAAWRDGLALADWVRRRGDVTRLHAQFAGWDATAARVAGALSGVAFSFEVHNPYLLVVGRGALAAKVRAADVVTAISATTRRRVVDLVPEAEGRVRVVRCGVDVAHPPAATAATPRYDVVAVGSLVPRKGHDVFVRAVAGIAASRPVRAAIVGEGPERARLAAAIVATGAPVTLLGALTEAEAGALAAAARVAALACVVAPDGDEDGVPVALMEAMAAGVPVVSTTVGGMPELLDDGRAGLLVAPGDAAGLASALGRLLDDPELADKATRPPR